MKILITGAAGFIGSHLVSHHLQKGDEVLGIDNLSTGSTTNIEKHLSNPRFHFTKADLLGWDYLAEAVLWADRIYHMAARVGVKYVLEHPFEVISENIHSCEKILMAAAKRERTVQLLLASSSCVYGYKGAANVTEESPMIVLSGTHVLETYAVSKITSEVMALCFSKHPHIHFVIARYFNIIGPHQTGRYGMVVPTFIEQALQGRPITVFGDGSQTRSFCSVHDAIKASDSVLSTPSCSGEIFNIGSPNEISILKLAELIKQRTNSSSDIVLVPYDKAYSTGYIETLRRSPVIDKITKATGYHPHISLEGALDEMISLKKRALGL